MLVMNYNCSIMKITKEENLSINAFITVGMFVVTSIPHIRLLLLLRVDATWCYLFIAIFMPLVGQHYISCSDVTQEMH